MTNKPQALDEQMIELLPCPFCGAAPHLEPNGAVKGGQIVVADCGRGCPCWRMYAEVELWNTRAAHSLMAAKVAELEDERSFVWKWIERAIFDDMLSPGECLSTLAGYPGAPWMNGRWDVDHEPYAERFYKRFPRAALAPDLTDYSGIIQPSKGTDQ